MEQHPIFLSEKSQHYGDVSSFNMNPQILRISNEIINSIIS